MSGITEDLADERVPRTWFWTVEDVCKWIKEEVGFPQYVECFEKNRIDGRKLVHMTSANLPKIGIYDWKDIKEIAKGIRMLLTVHVEDWFRSISLPPRESLALYLEKKSRTGEILDDTCLQKFMEKFEETKWEPPLANMTMIMPD